MKTILKKMYAEEYNLELQTVDALVSESESVINSLIANAQKIKQLTSSALDTYNDLSGNKANVSGLANDWVNTIKKIKELGIDVDPKYLKLASQLSNIDNIKIADLRTYLFEAYNHPIIGIKK